MITVVPLTKSCNKLHLVHWVVKWTNICSFTYLSPSRVAETAVTPDLLSIVGLGCRPPGLSSPLKVTSCLLNSTREYTLQPEHRPWSNDIQDLPMVLFWSNVWLTQFLSTCQYLYKQWSEPCCWVFYYLLLLFLKETRVLLAPCLFVVTVHDPSHKYSYFTCVWAIA